MGRSAALNCYRSSWLALAVLVAPTAFAQHVVSGSIGATSDFVFRGLSYTQGGPAVQASLDVELKNRVYVGGFLSSTNPNPGPSPNVEFDFWAGRQWDLKNGFSADLRFTHYMYPDDPRLVDYDRDEITATFGVRDAVFVAATYSSNTDAISSAPGTQRGDTWVYEISGRHRLSQHWSVTAGIGKYSLDNIYYDDYAYWNATLSANYSPWEVHIAALGSQNTAEKIFGSRSAGERVAVTVLYRFTTVR